MGAIVDGLDVGKNFEIISALTIPVTKAANNTQGTTQVAHGLNYKPAYLAFFTTDPSQAIYYPTPYLGINTVSGIVNSKADIVTDEDTVNCWFITPQPGSFYGTAFNNLTFYVYLLRQPIPIV